MTSSFILVLNRVSGHKFEETCISKAVVCLGGYLHTIGLFFRVNAFIDLFKL